MKSALLAAALLLTASAALAQAPAPAESAAPAAAPVAPRPVVRKPVVAHPVAPAPAPVATAKLPDSVEITQIVGIRQTDPTTYEIDAKTGAGAPINLHMNVFVMQDLGRQLGTYGK